MDCSTAQVRSRLNHVSKSMRYAPCACFMAIVQRHGRMTVVRGGMFSTFDLLGILRRAPGHSWWRTQLRSFHNLQIWLVILREHWFENRSAATGILGNPNSRNKNLIPSASTQVNVTWSRLEINALCTYLMATVLRHSQTNVIRVGTLSAFDLNHCYQIKGSLLSRVNGSNPGRVKPNQEQWSEEDQSFMTQTFPT